MTKREWLLNRGYKEYSANGEYHKNINSDFRKVINIGTNKYYLFYEDEAWNVRIHQENIEALTKMLNEVKADYETMLQECKE